MDQSVFNRTGLLSSVFHGDHTGTSPYRDLSSDQSGEIPGSEKISVWSDLLSSTGCPWNGLLFDTVGGGL